jgi:predicted nucleic acid-binding protein
MSDLTRWSVKVSKETDIALRSYLAERGGKKGDLSKFIERAVTRRPQIRSLIRPAEAGRLVNQLRADAELVTPLPATRRSDDPADDVLLAICDGGHADYLVTGDKAGLLNLATHRGTVILTARAFLDVITGR